MSEYLETSADKFTFRVAVGRLYSAEGVWMKPEAANRVRVGFTDFLQQRNGDVAFLSVKAPGTKVQAGDEIHVEPWRARAFPVVKDLVVDRSALDRIIAAGGYVSAPTGSAPDGNAILIPKDAVDTAMDAAQCIGCGACVAACKNASAMLFVAAKVSHLNLLPQGKAEKDRRALAMVKQMDAEGFGAS